MSFAFLIFAKVDIEDRGVVSKLVREEARHVMQNLKGNGNIESNLDKYIIPFFTKECVVSGGCNLEKVIENTDLLIVHNQNSGRYVSVRLGCHVENCIRYGKYSFSVVGGADAMAEDFISSVKTTSSCELSSNFRVQIRSCRYNTIYKSMLIETSMTYQIEPSPYLSWIPFLYPIWPYVIEFHIDYVGGIYTIDGEVIQGAASDP
jgi:hypothetical protein